MNAKKPTDASAGTGGKTMSELSATFERGESVWVTTKDGVTLPSPCAYGPIMLELFKGCTLSREKPAKNWATMVPQWMVDGFGPIEATKLRDQLIKTNVPCTDDTIAAIHAATVARWY